jgi:hypothetical protein
MHPIAYSADRQFNLGESGIMPAMIGVFLIAARAVKCL